MPGTLHLCPNVGQVVAGQGSVQWRTVDDPNPALFQCVELLGVVGEELDPGGYIIKSISPAQVVIGIKETNQTIILPVEEVN